MVAAQARRVEIQSYSLGQFKELAESVQRLSVGLLRAVHEFADLQMDLDHISTSDFDRPSPKA
jgi:hypothetical protein